jgi:hypothetical protein
VDEQSLFCFVSVFFIEHERWRFLRLGRGEAYVQLRGCLLVFLRLLFADCIYGQTDAARRGRGGMGVRYSSSFVASNRYGMVWYIDMEELYCRILLSFYHEEVAVIFVSSRSPACSFGNFLVALVCRLEPGFVFDEVWVGIGEVLSDGWVRRRIFGRVFDGLIVRDCLMGENRLLGLSCLSSI